MLPFTHRRRRAGARRSWPRLAFGPGRAASDAALALLLGAWLSVAPLPGTAWAQDGERPAVNRLGGEDEPALPVDEADEAEMKREFDALRGRVEELEGRLGSEDEPAVTPGEDPVALEISGQVSQVFLYADNGEEDDAFIADNDNAESRLAVEGTADLDVDLTVGAYFELGLGYNSTDEIEFGQDEPNDEDFLAVRHLEAFVEGERFGLFAIGFGDTAAEDASEQDVSGTTAIAEADVDDAAGGLNFANGVEINEVFENLDGSRSSRVRYDTPIVGGAYASFSLREDGGILPEVALFYGNESGGYAAQAAIAYIHDKGVLPDVDSNTFTGSLSVGLPVGLSLTASAGIEMFDDGEVRFENDDGTVESAEIADEWFAYGKVAYGVDAFGFGRTIPFVDLFFGRDAFFDDESIEGLITDGDENADALSIGAGFVQAIEPLSVEAYGLVRYHGLELPDDSPAVRAGTDADPDPIVAVLTGFTVYF